MMPAAHAAVPSCLLSANASYRKGFHTMRLSLPDFHLKFTSIYRLYYQQIFPSMCVNIPQFKFILPMFVQDIKK